MKPTETLYLKRQDYKCCRCSCRFKIDRKIFWGGEGYICETCFGLQRKKHLKWIERCWAVSDSPLHHSWPKCTLCQEAPQHKDYVDVRLGICIGCLRSIEERWNNEESEFHGSGVKCIVCRQNYVMKDYDLCKWCNWLDCWHRKQRSLAPRKVGEGVWMI